jgi:hypothetical protein
MRLLRNPRLNNGGSPNDPYGKFLFWPISCNRDRCFKSGSRGHYLRKKLTPDVLMVRGTGGVCRLSSSRASL